MANTRNTRQRNRFLNFFINIFIQEKGGVLTGIIVALLAVIGFWLTPLQGLIFNLIWKETAKVEIIIQDNLSVIIGKKFPVKTAIYSTSQVPVTEGYLAIDYPKDAFESEGNAAISTPLIKNAYLLPEKGDITLTPKKIGKFKIFATLKTKYSSYKDSAIVNVIYINDTPSKFNFSGKWMIKFGNDSGEVKIVENRSSGTISINGEYSLNSGEQGSVSGFRDGDVFYVDFIVKSTNAKKWILVCRHNANTPFKDGFLEIKGNASRFNSKAGKWTEIPNSSINVELFSSTE